MASRRKEANRVRKQQQADYVPTHKCDLPQHSMQESERLRQECFKRAWAQKGAREAKKIAQASPLKPPPVVDHDDEFFDY